MNDNVLDFEDLLEHILNGLFHMNLPPSFKKVRGSHKEIEVDDTKPANSNNKGGKGKKSKSENGNGNPVKNSAKDEDFNFRTGETWQDTFSKQFPQDRPIWVNKIKMCAKWHIKIGCFNNCAHAISNVSKDMIPADKKADFLTFMSKCRAAKPAN